MGVGWGGARAHLAPATREANQGRKAEATRTRAGDAPYRMGNTGGEGKPPCLGPFCPLDNTPRFAPAGAHAELAPAHSAPLQGRRWCGVARPARDEHQLAAKVQAGAPRRPHPSRRAPHAHGEAGHLRSSHPCGAPQVFIGDQSVGKTSIISRFMYDQFDTHYASTIGACTARSV